MTLGASEGRGLNARAPSELELACVYTSEYVVVSNCVYTSAWWSAEPP